MAVKYGSLPFQDQIAFFRRKLNIPTRAWTDIYAAEHDHAFMVAGAMKRELLTDLRRAVDMAITQGTTLAEFRKDFDQVVATHGWSYQGGRGWRTRVIYDTNLRQSYNAGRRAQMKAVSDTRPYWRYRHNDAVEHPRPEHQAWDGKILRHDDPWWDTHTPQNAWGCHCFIETLSERDLKRLGKEGPDQAPPIEWEERTIGSRGPSPRTVKVPKGIDPGFEYAPGDSWLHAQTPRPLDGPPPVFTATGRSVPAMPAPQPFKLRSLEDGLDETAYAQAFLDELGGQGRPAFVFKDVAGEYLPLSQELFKDHRGNWKIRKEGRHAWLMVMAATLKDPDEIWLNWQPVKSGPEVLRRRYIRVLPGDQDGIAVFELGKDGWREITVFHVTDAIAQRHGYQNAREYIELQRGGLRIYAR